MPNKTIREITEITGITEKALRYYDEKGVLHPSAKSQSGRREWLYDEEAVWKIRLIAFYKTTGLSIEGIGKMLNGEKSEAMKLLEAHHQELKKECEKLDGQIVATELMLLIEELSCEEAIKEDLRKAITELYERRK